MLAYLCVIWWSCLYFCVMNYNSVSMQFGLLADCLYVVTTLIMVHNIC